MAQRQYGIDRRTSRARALFFTSPACRSRSIRLRAAEDRTRRHHASIELFIAHHRHAQMSIRFRLQGRITLARNSFYHSFETTHIYAHTHTNPLHACGCVGVCFLLAQYERRDAKHIESRLDVALLYIGTISDIVFAIELTYSSGNVTVPGRNRTTTVNDHHGPEFPLPGCDQRLVCVQAAEMTGCAMTITSVSAPSGLCALPPSFFNLPSWFASQSPGISMETV